MEERRAQPSGSSMRVVDKIESHKEENQRVLYQVRWVGSTKTTWESETEMMFLCSDMVRDYDLKVHRERYRGKEASIPAKFELAKLKKRSALWKIKEGPKRTKRSLPRVWRKTHTGYGWEK